ncbi:hypothetical protein [Sanguibacter sp. 25GB23B1]|uniref:hypothetical protein n=1 Tax=unclassified Sanguibacter TaxID=2645534 RepID=UPI0032AEF658
MQLAPPVRTPARGRARRPGRRGARRPSARSTRTLTNVMVLLFVLGGVGVARPSWLELLPDLDWDAGRLLELVGSLAGPVSEQPEPSSP